MKLSTLRSLLKGEQRWSFNRIIYGDYAAFRKMLQYIAAYEGCPEDYELTTLDLFPLVKIISPYSSKWGLIESMRRHLYGLPYLREIEGCFSLLSRKKLLNENAQTWIIENLEKTASLLFVLQELQAVNLLNQDCLEPLISKARLVEDLTSILKILKDQHLILTTEQLQVILFFKDIFLLNCTLNILSANHWIQENHLLLTQLFKMDPDRVAECYVSLKYLELSKIINQKTITRCFQALMQHKTALFKLISFLVINRFPLQEPYFNSLFLLSDRNLNRFTILLERLAQDMMLNQDSFRLALERVTIRLESAKAAMAIKKSRKQTHLPRSEMHILSATSSSLCFFMEHDEKKRYKNGGFKRVKKGYATLHSKIPLYSVKRLSRPNPHSTLEEDAEREVKFHRLLGREAFWFSRNKKRTIVSRWLHEKSLADFDPLILAKESYEKRLRCLIAGLRELNQLHAYFCVHGDIKAGNFILNLQEASMSLIDFGSARKLGSIKNYSRTKVYCDPQLQASIHYQFCDDMYSMGIVVAKLFPELFIVSYFTDLVQVNKRNPPTTLFEQALVDLLDNMMNVDRQLRCTSEAALNFCQDLHHFLPSLNERQLREIKASSIDRSEPKLEDLFRGRLRA